VKALVFVGLIAVAVACGDSSGPGKQAASVTGIAGDSQLAPTGAQLAFPLSLVALGSNGQPVQDLNVTWSATPAGGVTFNPQSTPTDVNGVASTTVTAGTTPGEIVIQATVPGVSPVVYHALVLEPCAYAASYTIGQTVNGALTTTDCNFQQAGWYYDFYAFVLPTGQHSLRITMQSTAFDTYLDLFRADGPQFGFDDDIVLGEQQNSQLDIILPGDTYIIGANSFRRFAVGSYSLSTVARPAAMNGCRQVWVARGVSVSDSITTTDCSDTAATYYDVARMVVYGGTVLTISATSPTMNPALALYQLTIDTAYVRTLVASNDDSTAATTKAFIQYPVGTSSYFDILIKTSTAGETGPYTFDVSASLTLSPLASAPPPPRAVSHPRPGWRGTMALPTDALHLFTRTKL
jgi:hypothetical protein